VASRLLHELDAFTEFVGDDYWHLMAEMTGKSLDELFSLLKETGSSDEFVKWCFPAPERRRLFLDADQQALVERGNVIRKVLGVAPYNSISQSYFSNDANL